MASNNNRIGVPIYRRTVLKGALATTVAGIGTAVFGGQTAAQEERSIYVNQGGNDFVVTPLSTGESIEQFYGIRQGFADTSTDIEKHDVSHLFLWDGPNGLSLVVIHDRRGNATGGAATFSFSGLPTDQGQWVVQDEAADFDSETDTEIDWRWVGGWTDGGAFRGGLDGEFDVTIDPAFNGDAGRESPDGGQITEWQFLSGDATDPDQIKLDMSTPVTITTQPQRIEVDIDIKPGGDANPINPDGHGVIPVAILHTDEFDPVDRVNVGSLRFGRPHAVDNGGGASPTNGGSVDDVDGDGNDDLVVHFPTRETGFVGDEIKGKLVGEMADGTPLVGTDKVVFVGGTDGTSSGRAGRLAGPGGSSHPRMGRR